MTAKKTKKKSPSKKQRLFAKAMLKNGGIASAAARDAGYSDSMIRNPQKITGSKAYKDILDAAGLTDDMLAQSHRELAQAAELKEFKFPHIRKTELVEIDEEDPKYLEDGPAKQFKEEIDYKPLSEKVIKAVIEKIPGAKLVRVELEDRQSIAYYTVPMHLARKAAVELAYKAKGHFMADKWQGPIGADATEEEKAAVMAALKAVKHVN